MEPRLDTRLAVMQLTDSGRVMEVHYREGHELDVEGLLEVQQRRGELTAERCGMIAFFPPGTLGSLAVMEVDYFRATKAEEQLVALAIVSADTLGDALSSIYYRYSPQPFATRMFRDERDARTWLRDEMERAGV
ncbi:MAG TPA: hypothetical protein PLN54_08665 [Flavobacteriales bacterium]|nr:hypothetical protein [Flavobacteriales bacterium]